MSSAPSTNFDFLEALGKRINADLSAVAAQLRRAEWIHKIAPEPCIMQCRSASEVLARAFQTHLSTPAARVSGLSLSDVFRALAAESRRQSCHVASRAWLEMPNLYRDWSEVVHANVGATSDTAIRALRSLHKLAADLHKDYCAGPPPQFCTPNALADIAAIAGMHAELKKAHAEKKAFERMAVEKEAECLDLRRRETELAKRHDKASAEVQDLRTRIGAGAAPNSLRRRADELEQKVRQHETQRQSLASQLKQADDSRREAEHKAAQMETRIEQLERDREAQKSVIRQLEESLSNASLALADARVDVDRITREMASSRSQGEQAATELQAALRDRDNLQRRQATGDHSKQLAELLQRSEQRVGDFESQVARLADENADKESQLLVARKQSTALETTVQELRQGLNQMRHESAEARTELSRLAAYRTSYPHAAEAVPAFLHALLYAQPEPLPPFQQLSNVVAIPADPYYERHHASHANQACTVRIATRRTDRPIEDLLDAWRLERFNLGYVGDLDHRRGIARLLLIADPERPGFSVFARPSAPLLGEFGRGARRHSLRHSARVALSLLQEIKACWDAGMITSWPDIDSIALQGDYAIMLDPVASHFGDLGPPHYVERRSSDARYLSEHEMAAALAFVAANAFFRVVGLLPPRQRLSAELPPRSATDYLLEARRAETQAVDNAATERLAALMAAATQGAAARRPSLSDLKNALEEVGRPNNAVGT